MTASLVLTRSTAQLAPRFDLGAFSCGDEAFDRWLANCINQVSANSVMVFILADEELLVDPDGDPVPVAGYFALALTVIEGTEMSRSMAKGQERVPAYLLARLALSTDLRGGTEGSNLLAAPLAHMVRASETVPSRLLVIDAERPEVAQLYADWGFVATRGLREDIDPETGCYRTNLRLIAKTSSIRAVLPSGLL